MSRLRNPGLVLLQGPVPVTVGPGGLAPILALGLLFAGIGLRGGLPVATATIFGAVGGTASLIAHELGHARAARKLVGLRPTGISLIWLGAATRLEGKYTSGRDQAKVAIAGPRVSFAVALALIPVLFLPMPVGLRDILITLAALNVAIGVLSLIPASPLDGYKLIVGLLWSALGSEAQARSLIRRFAMSWAAVEVAGTAVLLWEKPLLGTMVVAVGASLFGQKLFARRSPA
jgi:Zn-dependent protease